MTAPDLHDSAGEVLAGFVCEHAHVCGVDAGMLVEALTPQMSLAAAHIALALDVIDAITAARQCDPADVRMLVAEADEFIAVNAAWLRLQLAEVTTRPAA